MFTLRIARYAAMAVICAWLASGAQAQDRASAAASVAATGGHSKASVSGADISDIWWPNDEPGWGIQFVQNADIAFATMYVYDASGRPTFYVALLTNSPFGTTVWTGPLSGTTGPYFGGPFDPNAVVETVVGTMTFVRDDAGSGRLFYTIGATSVSKTIHRQPLKLESESGLWQFQGVVTSASSECAADSFAFTSLSRIHLSENAGAGTWTIDLYRDTLAPFDP
ncbi:MAG: hypothetical protein J0L91_01290 [Burkholderiales bacterium]|nr:hypothetical protein [Burkholderiales bacterium]